MGVIGHRAAIKLLKAAFPFERLILPSVLGKCRNYSDHYNYSDNQIIKTFQILKNDAKQLKYIVKSPFYSVPEEYIFPYYCDIVVIGGGIMGLSAAYWLKQRALDNLRVVVVERDFTVNADVLHQYKRASTVMSAGGIRQQFSLKENIELSIFGAEFLRKLDFYLGVMDNSTPDIQFTPSGYLFLASERGAAVMEENFSLQRSLGVRNELLSVSKLNSKFPWLNTDGIHLGCHGLENEGWFDPWSLMSAFKMKLLSLGTEFVTGEVVGFEFDKPPPTSTAKVDYIPPPRHVMVKMNEGDTRKIQFGQAIIAAGANSGEVGKLCGIGTGRGDCQAPIPVEPRKRYVYCFHCADGPGLMSPLVVDPTGTYVRREGLNGTYITGRSPLPEEEPPVDNLQVDHEYFNEMVWPVLAHRIPSFENIKVKSAWAGFYDYNTFDENAFVGPHPTYSNVFMATGFSGHGLQHAPGVGRALMEMILDGELKTIDVSRLDMKRYFEMDKLLESNIV